MTRVLLLAAALAASPALAQPTAAPPVAAAAPGGVDAGGAVPALPRVAAPLRLSPGQAVLLSVGATAGAAGLGYVLVRGEASLEIGLGLLAAGAFLGPSAGNLAQGNARGALIGSGLRAGGAALAYGGALTVYTDGPEALAFLGAGAFLVGAGAYVVGVIYDLATAGQYASRASASVALDPHSRAPVLVVRVGL